MKNIALNLYRKWHRFRHPAQKPLSPDDAEMPRSLRVKEALDQRDFNAAEEWANSLLAFPANEREDEVINGLGALLTRLMAYGARADVLALLNEWRAAFSDSHWPARLELLYWAHVAAERRGADTSNTVSEAQWQDAWVVGQALFLQGIALLGHGMDWFVAHTLCRHAQVFHAPEWADAWCYGQAVEADDVPSTQQLVALASPILQDEWGIAQVTVPGLPASRPESVVQVAERVSPDAPNGFFWLMVGMGDSPHGYYLIHDYAFLRTDRWGGEEGEILAIASSPLCEHLTDAERQALRSIQWRDEVTSLVFEDPYMRDADKRAKKALKRGDLSPNAHYDMLHWMHAGLFERWPSILKKTPLFQWRLLRSMRGMIALGHQYQTDFHLRHALYYRARYGCFPDELMPLLVPACQYNASYATLYGLFCEHGWGGLQQDLALAQQWYAYAARLNPPGARSGDMVCGPYALIEEHFSWEECAGPLWNALNFFANAGYADAQMRLGGICGEHDQRRDVTQSVQWFRKAVRDGQPDTYKALYYIGASYTDDMRYVDAALFPKTTPLSRAAYGMDAYIEFLERMSAHPVDSWTSDQNATVLKALRNLRYVLACWPDHHAEYLQPTLRLLTRYADTLGVADASVAIAYIWSYLPEDSHWEKSVRLMARLRQQHPDNEEAVFVYNAIRESNGGARVADFDRIAASIVG